MPRYRNSTDCELLKLLAGSDEIAFEEIYRRYSPAIYKTALRFLQDESRAADLVQEIFTKLWADRKNFADVRNLKAYLITMSRNLALRYLKEIARESIAKEVWAAGSHSHSENNTENFMNKKGLENLLDETIALLPPQQRKVYYLARIKGLTYKAISDQMKISTVTVKKHMIAANRFVRERIKQHAE